MIGSQTRGPARRSLLIALILAPSIFMYLYQVVPGVRHHTFQRPAQNQQFDLAEYPHDPSSDTTVNLVVATVEQDDISWTKKLRIPNLNIVRYVSDSPTARYHTAAPKGREALQYHTYFYEFYDDLPDVSILVHPHETPWHIDSALHSSMLFALSRLDLKQVRRSDYVNLRVSWYQACPDWINTTKAPEESWKQEEPFMAAAFRANFGDEIAVPEILAGPCCSQFAVTREAIRRRPREQYRRNMEWLLTTNWNDYITGRTWEHMWPWLFKEEATDCAVEWKKLCRFYGVCFQGPEELGVYQDLWKERQGLEESTEFWREIWDPDKAQEARRRMRDITGILDRSMADAVQRGKDERIRMEAGADLYTLQGVS